MNIAVSLVWYAKTPNGWKRFNVLTGANGRIRTGVVRENGKEVKYPIGRFQLRMYAGTKTIYRAAGANAAEAETARRRALIRSDIRQDAASIGLTIPVEAARVQVSSAGSRFVQRTRDSQATVAANVYQAALRDFSETMSVTYVDEIDGDVMLAFNAAMRKRGNGDRTVVNKHLRVCAFLRWAGVDLKAKGIRVPKHEKKLPTVYAQTDLDALLAQDLDLYWRMVIMVLRQTGLREREAIFLQWGEIDFGRKMLRVRSNPKEGFTIKDKEERDVPIPDALVKDLKSWKAARPKAQFVLGTGTDRPNTKLLRGLKRLVYRAGLNCGTCDGCVARNECRKWNLHAFRRSYATSLSRAGIDARTIMALMGHADIETTMRYLAAMTPETAQPLINKVKW